MDKVVIFGGTGFIGLSLATHLESKGLTPIIVARNTPNPAIKHDFLNWEVGKLGSWVTALEDAKAIVNLAGRTVDCVKTPDNCDVILRSRVEATRTIGQAVKTLRKPPAMWVQMSTAHIYGDPPEAVCTENSTTGYGLAPFVAKAWEQAFMNALPATMRGVRLRTSFVIGKNGGALNSLKTIVRLGLGGTVGHGRQGMSWIHEYDMNEIIYASIINPKYEGVYIASSPKPVPNYYFMRKLRKKMGVPIGLPAPEFITRLGAHFIFKTDPELALYGRYVMPERLLQQGFDFTYPDLKEALDTLI